LLTVDHIVIPVQGETLRLATVELVEAMSRSGAITDQPRFEELVGETLPQDVVTVGQAFLLYFRTEAVRRLTVALGVARKPMHREHDPAKQASMVLLISAPPRHTSRFLRTVSAFSHALGREEIVAALLAAQRPEDVLAIQALGEIELWNYVTVRDVMVRRQISIRPDAKLGEAANKMVLHDVPSLLVVSDTNEVLGLVTHRELLRYLLPARVKRLTEEAAGIARDAATPDPFDIPVREVMDRSVLCVSEGQTVAEVATMILNRKIDRFPVVRDGTVVGFLTEGDIVRGLFGR
jgi:CBS domain-containing protein